MCTTLHEAQDACPLLEVELLRSSEWVFLEERDDDLHELAAPLHGEAERRAPIIVSMPVLDDPPTPEVLEKHFERSDGAGRLRHRELMLDLPAESTGCVAHHRDRESAFAVDEADDPLLDTWPFLLIVRTERIFTDHERNPRGRVRHERVPSDARSFQQIASCTLRVTTKRGNPLARIQG